MINGGNMTITQTLFDNYLNNRSSIVTAYNGSSSIPMYNGALENINITATFPGTVFHLVKTAYNEVSRVRLREGVGVRVRESQSRL